MKGKIKNEGKIYPSLWDEQTSIFQRERLTLVGFMELLLLITLITAMTRNPWERDPPIQADYLVGLTIYIGKTDARWKKG